MSFRKIQRSALEKHILHNKIIQRVHCIEHKNTKDSKRSQGDLQEGRSDPGEPDLTLK